MEIINIFTDGSCKGNPGPGGYAALFLMNNEDKPFKIIKGNESATTNNRMEMVAIIEALKFLHKNNFKNKIINLYSDSNLIIQTLLKSWKKKANVDLWEQLENFKQGLNINFIWIKGHAKNKWNNECDKIAQMEASKAKRKLA